MLQVWDSLVNGQCLPYSLRKVNHHLLKKLRGLEVFDISFSKKELDQSALQAQKLAMLVQFKTNTVMGLPNRQTGVERLRLEFDCHSFHAVWEESKSIEENCVQLFYSAMKEHKPILPQAWSAKVKRDIIR